MVFTKPVTVPIHMELITDTEMLEYYCENEKDRAHMSASKTPFDVKVAAEILQTYAGSYDVKEDDGKTSVVEMFAEAGGLYLNYANQGKQKLDALSETTFSLTGTIFEFLRDGQKPVNEFRIKMAEGELTGLRRE